MSARILPLHILSIGSFSNTVNTIRFTEPGNPYTTRTWRAANLAVYMPIHMPAGFTVARFMIANGVTLTGTVDVGLYSIAGTRLLSTGNTARAGASAIQYIDVTNTYFPAGHYYLAQAASSAAGTYGAIILDGTFGAAVARSFGALEETLGAAVLPTTMTPTAYVDTDVFFFGFTQSDTL